LSYLLQILGRHGGKLIFYAAVGIMHLVIMLQVKDIQLILSTVSWDKVIFTISSTLNFDISVHVSFDGDAVVFSHHLWVCLVRWTRTRRDEEGWDGVIPFFVVSGWETTLSVKEFGISTSSKKSWMSSSLTDPITRGDL
jgi:hypothetical protein